MPTLPTPLAATASNTGLPGPSRSLRPMSSPRTYDGSHSPADRCATGACAPETKSSSVSPTATCGTTHRPDSTP